MLFAHNPRRSIQTEARAVADLLRSEKGLEDARTNFRRNSRTIVADLDDDAVQFPERVDAQLTLAVHGVDCVVDEIRPNLVQFATIRANAGQVRIVFPDYGDACFQTVPKYLQC